MRTNPRKQGYWWIGVLLWLIPALAWAAPVMQGAPGADAGETQPTLVVGVYDSGWPPFEFIEDGEVNGFAPDLLSQLAASTGMKVEYRRYPDWMHVLDAACRGEIDVVMNIAAGGAAHRCLLYTAPYARSPMAVVGRPDDLRASEDPDLVDLRVVTEQGFLTGPSVRARFPAARQLQASGTLQALQQVQANEADVYIGNAFVASQLIRTHQLTGLQLLRPSDLPEEALRFGVVPSRPQLLERLDSALAALPAVTRTRIEHRWLQPPVWSAPARRALDQAEQRALSTPLKIGFAPNAAPLSFADANGRPDGLASVYLKRLVAAGATLTPETSHDWYEVREKMRSGQLDAVMGVPADSTYLGDDWVFSQPFIQVPNVIVTRRGSVGVIDLDDLDGKRVLLSDPDRLRSKVLQAAPQARVVAARSTEQALQRLRDGEADAYVGNLAAVDRLLRDRFAEVLQVAAPAGFDDPIALAVKRRHAALATTFDRVLQQMDPNEREALRDAWLASDARTRGDWPVWLGWAVPLALLLLAGLVVHLLGCWRLRRELAERRQLEQRLEDLTSNLPAVIYQMRRSVDGDISFPYIAGDLQALFGIDRTQAMADVGALLACIDERDRAAVEEKVQQAARAFSPLAMEYRTAPHGRSIWVRSQAQPYATEAGTVTWSGYWVDVTEARAQADALLDAKAAAEQAVAAKARFLAVMSHEIRTPMSGVLGMLEMLAHGQVTAEQRRQVELAESAAQNLQMMLDDILDYAKIDAGALRLDPLPMPLRPLLEALQQQFEGTARSKGLHWLVKVDPRLATVHEVDGLRLRQVLYNLLGNAFTITRQGSVILRVDVLDASSPSLQSVRLSVVDTGEGYAPEQLSMALQPLVDPAAVLPVGMAGTGLGLSISQRLVQLMGGQLVVHSVPHRGTEVEVVLQLLVASDDDVAAALPGGQGAEPLPVALQQANVLVLEDHPVAQAMMAWRLEKLGVRHALASDGRQGLHLLASQPFSLVIADCHMPVMDGYVFTRLLREREGRTGGPRLPVVALTASTLADDQRRCHDAGMDEVLLKPLSLAQLRECLLRWLTPPQG